MFAFDPATYHDWNRRDAGMAENILARAAKAPDALVLTLTGNLHNRLTRGLPWDESLVPAGVHVDADRGSLGILSDAEAAIRSRCNCDIAVLLGWQLHRMGRTLRRG